MDAPSIPPLQQGQRPDPRPDPATPSVPSDVSGVSFPPSPPAFSAVPEPLAPSAPPVPSAPAAFAAAPAAFAASASAALAAVPVLECRGLTKRYGSAAVALNAVNLVVPRGRIVGLLGPNGSGKTTLIKLIAGLLQPTCGTLRVEGEPVGPSTKAKVSYLPERPYFPASMKVSEALAFFGDFYADFDRRLAEDMLARLCVPVGEPFAALSKGTKEKVQLVLVMARHASLYLLDEPIGGVDPAARDYILDTVISNYRRDATILLSTHLVADVERVLDDFVFLHYGTMALYMQVDQLRQQTGMTLDAYFRSTFGGGSPW